MVLSQNLPGLSRDLDLRRSRDRDLRLSRDLLRLVGGERERDLKEKHATLEAI